MVEELATLHQTHTWDIVPLSPRKRPIERYKARLLVKGYSQECGMDYKETFALMAKMIIVYTLIVVISISQWKIFQTDVKNVFLNGDLHEEIYMTPTLGVSHKFGEVCKLQKTLYSLKQAPYAQFEKFSTIIVSLGFVASYHDFALFLKRTSAFVFCYHYMLI